MKVTFRISGNEATSADAGADPGPGPGDVAQPRGAGYFITGDVTDEQVFEDLSVWSPYVTFELHRTIPFPKASEIVLKALKARAGRA